MQCYLTSYNIISHQQQVITNPANSNNQSQVTIQNTTVNTPFGIQQNVNVNKVN